MTASAPPFRIYNASAGSGKTYTLTREYLSLLLSARKGQPFRKILAITFTNKAVGELKSRILEALEVFSSDRADAAMPEMFAYLCQTLGVDSGELRERSARMLQEILHNYAFFDVSTIDKFNHRILRTFAKDLRLPPGFEVVTDTDSLLKRAVDALIQKAGSEKRLTDIMLAFALEKAEEDRHWDVSLDLLDMGKLLFNENDLPFLEMFRGKGVGDFLALRQLLDREARHCESGILEVVEALQGLLHAHGLETGDFNRGSFPKFLSKLADGQFESSFTSAWQRDFGEKPLWITKTPDHKKEIMDDLLPQFAEGFGKIKERVLKRAFLLNARKNITPFTVMGLLRLELEQIQETESLLPVAHFNAIIAGELAEQPAAYIYERLGEKYRYYFIDEFQDTSLLQWQNLIPLITNALSGQDASGTRGGLILVGDAKQAIYRWRGGRAEQFMGLSEQLSNPFPVAARIEPLPKNYRSRETLVSFNNRLFHHLGSHLSRETHAALFTSGSRQESRSEEEGLVQLEFLEAENADLPEAYARRAVEILQELRQSGYPWSDVCLLTRRRAEGVTLSEALAENGIPVVSSETLLLKNHPAVRFLIALLRHLKDPSDQNAPFEMLYFLCPAEGDTHSWIAGHLPRFPELLRDRYGFATGEAAFQPVYDILENAIACFELGGDAAAYLIFLLDLALEVGNRGDQSITTFLEQWEARQDVASLKAPENQDAVRLMTIHQSKGLEFPIVLYPFAETPVFGYRQGKLWVPVPKEAYAGFSYLQISKRKEVAEYGPGAARAYEEEQANSELDAMNILYVAHTRAEKALFVLSRRPKSPGEQPGNYAELYRSFLEAEGSWEEGQSVYTFGALPPAGKGSPPARSTKLPFRHSTRSAQSLRMVTRTGRDWASGSSKAISLGNLVHYAMSLIRVREDTEAALERLGREGLLRIEQQDPMRTLLHGITGHPRLEAYFRPGWEIYNERELFIRKAVFLRPDRFQIQKGEAVVMDYKTGQARPKHREQLTSYADEIGRMGFRVSNAILVYVKGTEVTLEEL